MALLCRMVMMSFPLIDLFDMSYYFYDDKIESQITLSEALGLVLETVAEDEALSVRKKIHC